MGKRTVLMTILAGMMALWILFAPLGLDAASIGSVEKDGRFLDTTAAKIVSVPERGDGKAIAAPQTSLVPTLTGVSATDVVEGNSTTLSGTMGNISPSDSMTLTVNWGDSSSDVYKYPAGTTSFSESHQYTDDDPSGTAADLYTVNLTLEDESGGSVGDSTNLTVSNADPQVGSLLANASINENGLVGMSGVISDAGVQDTFSVVVDWGDGITETIPYPAGTSFFFMTHTYLDDPPTGTPSDLVPINVTVTDDDTGTGSGGTTVTVNNVNPALTNVTAGNVTEFGQTTLTGNIGDVGTQDTFSLTVTWGDGQSDIYLYPAGTTAFTETHQYLDDKPSGTASDSTTIDLTLEDDDGGTATDSATITVDNIPPALLFPAVGASVNENNAVTLTGIISDTSPLDTFSLDVDWGDGMTETFNYPAGASILFETHQYLDDDPTGTASDPYTITLALQDDDGGLTGASLGTTVNNVEPLLLNLNTNSPITENELLILTGVISDAGSLDTFELVIGWGDGMTDTVAYPAGSDTFSATHKYILPNSILGISAAYDIDLILTDDDGGSDTANLAVTANSVPPSLSNISAGDIFENGVTTLSGDIGDLAANESVTLTVDWDDGNTDTYNYPAGTTSFSESHQYEDDDPSGTSSDIYTIDLTAEDSHGDSANSSENITVTNVDPALFDLASSSPIDIDGVVTVTGSISDVGLLDSFNLAIDWGDGMNDNYPLAAGTTGFTVTHEYTDDTTAIFTVTITLTDDDTGSETKTLSVASANPPLTLNNITANDVVEAGFTALSGNIGGAGPTDPLTLTVSWGDGSSDIYNYPPGTTTFFETHQYLDDDPSGTPTDIVTITLDLEDDDGGSTSGSVTIDVDNVSPVLLNLDTNSPINEHGVLILSGLIDDASALDSFSLEIDWGDGNSDSFSYAAGTSAFADAHRYLDDNPSGTPSDAYTLTLTLSDDDTGVFSETLSIIVDNVAPILSDVAATDVVEAGLTTLSGLIDDPGTTDTFTLTVNWGDGQTNAYAYGAGTTSFSEMHQYLDDNPSGTASDLYTITLSLEDDDGGTDADSTTLTVSNSAPQLSNLSTNSPINENATLNISGVINDLSALDTFTLTVDWGDGGSDTTNYAAGTVLFFQTHQYLDDNPTGTPSDSYTITLTIEDDDTGSGQFTSVIVVNNVQPALSNIAATDVTESGSTTLSGTIGDAGSLDTFSLTVNWGDGQSDIYTYPAGTTAFSENHLYSDDNPSGTSSDIVSINLTLEDDDGGSDGDSTNITVSNADPVLLDLATNSPIIENGILTVTGVISDAGTLDAFSLTVDWGDGQSDNYNFPSGTSLSGAFSITHQYLDDNPSGTSSDMYIVDLSLEDDDGGTDDESLNIFVNNANPSLSSVGATNLVESGSTTLTGLIGDVGTQDTFTLTVAWGDGTSDTYAYAAGTSSFSESHQYLDDDPSSTPADLYTINLTLEDDDDGSAGESTNITISNADPKLLNVLTNSPINENDSLMISGIISDVGTLDTFALTVDWGDGHSDLFNYPAGTGIFNIDHQYPDDNPSGTPTDNYTVTLSLVDDDSGSAGEILPVTLLNTDPLILDLATNSPIGENEVLTVTGVISDAGPLDTFEMVVNWGDGHVDNFAYPAGTGVFAESHLYLDTDTSGAADAYTITLDLADDDGGTATGSAVVTVENQPPTLSNLAATNVVESAFTTLSGVIGDASLTDSFTLNVQWGDGNDDTYNYPAGTTAFSETHQYLDDDPSGSPADSYTIDLTLQDDDGGTVQDNVSLVVSNAEPQLLNLVDNGPLLENGGLVVSGVISDVGSLDTFTMTVDWGDGSSESFTYPAGTNAFSEFHQYLDDDPGDTPADVYTVSLALEDDDGGTDVEEAAITVENVEPLLLNVTSNSPITENGELIVTGVISDPGSLDTFDLIIDWGEGLTETVSYPAGTAAFTVTHQYLDDNPSATPSDSYAVSLTLKDDDGGEASSDFDVTVNNRAPVILNLISNSPVDENDILILTGVISDVGSLDTFDLSIDWGDGSMNTFIYPSLETSQSGTFSITHKYEDAAAIVQLLSGTDFTIDLQLRDDDTGTYTDTLTVTANNVPPTLSDVTATNTLESGWTTLSGVIGEVSPKDTFTLTVDWGDGSRSYYFYPAGTTAFSVTHQYLDDNPSGTAADPTVIILILQDDDEGTTFDSTTITVANVAPELVDIAATSPVDEGDELVLTGIISDVSPLDTFVLVLEWGDGLTDTVNLPAGTKAFTVTHIYLDDDPSNTGADIYQIDIFLADDDTGTATDSISTVVNNVPPAVNAGPDQSLRIGGTVFFSGSYLDAGILDTHTVLWDFGDGSTVTGTLTTTHKYGATGFYDVILSVTDDDHGIGVDYMRVTVTDALVYIPAIAKNEP